jgi:DNA-binding transcriptional regulator PaaX
MSWVLRHSEESVSGRRLVLLVLADHAHEDGTCSWPSIATIAKETRMSERGAQYALRKLEQAGRIVREGWSTHKTTSYRVIMEEPPPTQLLAAEIDRREPF